MKDRAVARTGAIPKCVATLLEALPDMTSDQTSNVFVANLPSHVTEQTLGNFFARAGPVGSVCIHYIALHLIQCVIGQSNVATYRPFSWSGFRYECLT